MAKNVYTYIHTVYTYCH